MYPVAVTPTRYFPFSILSNVKDPSFAAIAYFTVDESLAFRSVIVAPDSSDFFSMIFWILPVTLPESCARNPEQ
jgi:hypothetical protein